MDTVTVSVTREHILTGKRNYLCFCPVALAVREVLPTRGVSVSRVDVWTAERLGALQWVATLPDTARAWIQTFDEYGPGRVAPITFALNFQEAGK